MTDPQQPFRQAVLRRLATDLAVLADDVPSQRPATMPCCEVEYDEGGNRWLGHLCGDMRTRPGRPLCSHVHHKGDVWLAPSNRPATGADS